MNILVVAAHPDDEVLGCGGTIARLAQEGEDVLIAILGEGITSRYDQRNQADKNTVAALNTCSQQVAHLLGAKDLFMFGLPDNRFDTVPLLDVVKILETLINRLHPRIIYTHHPGDLNIDHAITFRAVLTAARPLPGSVVKEIHTFEIPSATEWSFQKCGYIFTPNVFMNITNTLDTKLMAMQVYESEMRLFPHPRSLDALRIIARRWGIAVGLEAAEAFEMVRKVY